MKETIARVARILELHIRAEKVVRSLDTALLDRGLPLSYADFRVLGCVLTLGPITLKHAADAMELPKTTMHYIMHKLEAAGYLQRSPGGKKSTPVFTATEAGRAAWGEAAGAVLEGPYGKGLSQFPPELLEGTVQANRQLWEHMGVGHQNESLIMEATVLAVAATELLVRAQKESEKQGSGSTLPKHEDVRTN